MNTALSIALSTVFHIKDYPYLPCPAVIKFHNISYTLTCYTDPVLLMHSIVSTYVQDRPRAGASYFRLVRRLRARKCEQARGSGGMLPEKNF